MPNIPSFRDVQRRRNSIHSFRNVLVSFGNAGAYDNKVNIPPEPDPTPPYLFMTFGDYPPLDIMVTNNGGLLSSGMMFYYNNNFSRWDGTFTNLGQLSSQRLSRSTANDWRILSGISSATRIYNNNSSNPSTKAPLTNWTAQSAFLDPAPVFTNTYAFSTYFVPDGPSSSFDDFYFNAPDYLSIRAAGSAAFDPVSLTVRRNLQSINLSRLSSLTAFSLSISTFLTAIDFSQNASLRNISLATVTSISSLNLSQNNQLVSVNLQTVTALRTLTLGSVNPQLDSLLFSSIPSNLESIQNLNNIPLLRSVTINTSIIPELDFSGSNSLATLVLNNNSLSSLRVPSVSSLKIVNVSNNSNLSAQIIDNIFRAVSANSGIFLTYTGTSQGRTSATDAGFIHIYRNSNFANMPTPFELDPVYPPVSTPSGYVPSNIQGNSMTVFAPVSGSNSVQFPELTGEYLKTGDVFNNRDVFRNNSDYFILYNSTQSLWTLVGPSSSSNTVWLSADPGVGDWGNPPSDTWQGRAYNTSANATGWFQRTTVFRTDMLLFSAYSYNNTVYTTGTEIAGEPVQGYNNNFRWKDLDFTGMIYAGWLFQGRAALISPVHCVLAHHYPPGFSFPPNNNTVYVYHSDGSRTTTQMVTGLRIGSTDIAIGILSAPVSAAQYFVLSGSNSQFRSVTAADSINNFLYGPSQTGKIGVGIPFGTNASFSTRNIDPSQRNGIFSVPNSLWHGEPGVTGDSTCMHWVVSAGRLVLAGHTQSGGSQPVGPDYGFYFDQIVQAVTALNVHQYGPLNANIYSITGVPVN